ncbi:uncharacterized protein N7482_009298 [Penicillium canariense]|uniref:Uncharacterized protein n=1 Tax=Penicillium canariense TaxID=189055 RepID=A0A9W9HQ42_9EURO|nr:uncharacterized protein N7482_009298 [Penicillium canariense]KAJ5152820.1 hypothetical protein N7482_009298 [Penicillium canariense]
MPPRAFTNPAPKTESARSALSSFTCTLCSKSYSRHPEYEAHISSRGTPMPPRKRRAAERKADAEAGLKVLDAPAGNTSSSGVKSGGGGGFKKGGFKSSFSTVKGPAAPVKKNVLGDEDDEAEEGAQVVGKEPAGAVGSNTGRDEEVREDAESDTDEEYARDRDGGGYYDPRRPTGCYAGCAGIREVQATS